MISNVENVIREYLPQVIHMSLATSRDNKPWVSELHFAYDEDLNIYFRSLPTRRHSKEIEDNPVVSGTIVRQHMKGEKPRGVYFEGRASKLSNVTDQDPAYIMYCERFATTNVILDEAKSEDGHQFYKISVDTFYLFDGIDSHPAKKYELPWSSHR